MTKQPSDTEALHNIKMKKTLMQFERDTKKQFSNGDIYKYMKLSQEERRLTQSIK